MRKKRQILHANIIITGFSVNNTTLNVSRALDHTAINYLEWIAFDEFRECRRTLPAVDVYLCLLYSGVFSFFLLFLGTQMRLSFQPGVKTVTCNNISLNVKKHRDYPTHTSLNFSWRDIGMQNVPKKYLSPVVCKKRRIFDPRKIDYHCFTFFNFNLMRVKFDLYMD